MVEYSDSDSDSDNDLEFIGMPRSEIQPRRTPRGKVLFPPSSHSGEHNSAAVLDRHAETAGQRAAVTSTPRVSFGDAYPRNGTPRTSISSPGDSLMSGSRYHSLNSQDSSLSTVDLGSQNGQSEATIVQSTPTPPRRYNLIEPRERRVPERYGQINKLGPNNPFYKDVTNPSCHIPMSRTNPFYRAHNPFVYSI